MQRWEQWEQNWFGFLQDMGIIHEDFPLPMNKNLIASQISEQCEQKKPNQIGQYTGKTRVNENNTQVSQSWWGHNQYWYRISKKKRRLLQKYHKVFKDELDKSDRLRIKKKLS